MRQTHAAGDRLFVDNVGDGVQHLLIPGNTKTAVIKTCRYNPLVNRTCAEIAVRYDTAILPGRRRRPRDKALFAQLDRKPKRRGRG